MGGGGGELGFKNARAAPAPSWVVRRCVGLVGGGIVSRGWVVFSVVGNGGRGRGM